MRLFRPLVQVRRVQAAVYSILTKYFQARTDTHTVRHGDIRYNHTRLSIPANFSGVPFYMNSRKLVSWCAAALALSLATSLPAAQAAEAPATLHAPDAYKVVFQVSVGDAQGWNLTLNNVKNVKQELGEGNVDVEIVVYGPGISMLKIDSPVASRIDEVLATGVKVVACQNTMKAQKLTDADMLPSIGYVPAGVVELIKKQRAGYAYIRP